MLERLRERTAPLFAPEEPERQMTLWTDHAEILGAIVDGDEVRAAELTADHVQHAFPGLGDPGECLPPLETAKPAAKPARTPRGRLAPLALSANDPRSR